MLSLKAKKLSKFPQQKVLLELCRRLANSIRALTLWLLRCGGEEQELIV
jgi:hypothetical protein